jgi:UPF0755 protein
MKKLIRIKYRILRFLIKVSILLLLIPVAYNFIPVHMGKSTFYIPSSDIDTVIDTLHANGYGVSLIDKLLLQFHEIPEKGWYTLNEASSKRFKFFNFLQENRAKTMRVKLYAGETSDELTKRLANDLKLDHRKLLLQYRSQTKYLEGDIFAGRYVIARKADEKAVITALFQMSKEKLNEFGLQYCGGMPNPLELKILLIIASIIQKETNDKHEMYLVSSVIQNRLDRGMKLQMDGTLNYGKHSRKAVTSKRIRKDTSYYNTYKHGGIPPAPLATVSIDALKAALNPKKTNYLFFMLNRKGKHDFASTYKEHLRNIKAYKRKN